MKLLICYMVAQTLLGLVLYAIAYNIGYQRGLEDSEHKIAERAYRLRRRFGGSYDE